MFPQPLQSLQTLTEKQRQEAIASLQGYPPYTYLLQDLAEVLESCLAALAKAKTEPELVRAGRVYQVAFSFYTALTEHPQNLKSQIQAELAMQPDDPFELTSLNPTRMQHLQDIDRAQSRNKKVIK